MAFYPYLNFAGNCREAFTRYQEIFGGELRMMPMSDMPAEAEIPAEQADLIMHATLMVGDQPLMGADDPTGNARPARGVYVNYSTTDVADAETVFTELAEGGEVTMPLAEAFFSPRFGMCVDRFGTPWMIYAESHEQPS